ncbi:MAG: hypothetical protein IKF17_01985 [Clostridia bacterium]|nr:hypothetical protein [Clostridia bacterium]
MRYRYRRDIHTTDLYTDDIAREETPRNKATAKTRKDDTNDRKKIHNMIKELKDLGYPKEEALKKLLSEFPNSRFQGFFEGWIENMYKEKKKSPFRNIIRNESEER